MEIPDSLSDMDSVPDTLSLSREAGVEAMDACFTAQVEDFQNIELPEFCRAIDGAIESLRSFSAAVEVSTLESLYGPVGKMLE